MQSSRVDFFSDPQWPLTEVEILSIANKSSSLDISIKDSGKKEEANKNTLYESASFDQECLLKLINSCYQFSAAEGAAPKILVKEEMFPDAIRLLQYQGMESQSLKSDVEFQVKKKKERKFAAKIKNKSKKHKIKHTSKYIILDKNMKLKLVEQAKETSVSQVSKKYGISINNICRWKKTCDRKRGAGRKITNIQMEKELIEWVKKSINTFGHPPLRKYIQEKAKQFSNNPDFKASKGWFERFVKRNKSLNLASYFGMRIQNSSNDSSVENREMEVQCKIEELSQRSSDHCAETKSPYSTRTLYKMRTRIAEK